MLSAMPVYLYLLMHCMFRVQGPGDRDTKKKLRQKQSNEEEYELSRFKPLLQTVLDVRSQPQQIV